MAERTWSVARVFAKALMASARSVRAGHGPGVGLPPSPQLAVAGFQDQQRPANNLTIGQVYTMCLHGTIIYSTHTCTLEHSRDHSSWSASVCEGRREILMLLLSPLCA